VHLADLPASLPGHGTHASRARDTAAATLPLERVLGVTNKRRDSMSTRFLLGVVCAMALGLLTPALAAAAKPFKVASPLDGKTVLPRHLRWVAVRHAPDRY
jgi:hypothetical protein